MSFQGATLTEPCLTVSGHTARAIHGELPPPVMTRRFLPSPVDQVDHDPNGPPHWDRIRARPLEVGGFQSRSCDGELGSQSHQWRRFPKPPYNPGQPDFPGPV